MARIEYDRIDLAIALRLQRNGGVQITIRSASNETQATIPLSTLADWFAAPNADVAALRDQLPWAGPRADWRTRTQNWQPSDKDREVTLLRRITLTLDDVQLAGWDWENALAAAFNLGSDCSSVRTTPVRPRVLDTPFTLPLRILQVERGNHRPIGDVTRAVFGGHTGPEVDAAVQVTECGGDQITATLTNNQWGHVDVLHFDAYPALTESAALLSTADLNAIGTLGWLLRLADVYRLRLIAIHVEDDASAAHARQLATALAARGGPAAIIAKFDDSTLGRLYDFLIHDWPLDAILLTIYPRATLIAGTGREEALRVSNAVLNLARLADEFFADDTGVTTPRVRNLLQYLRPDDILRHIFSALSSGSKDWRYDHESGGLLPFSQLLTMLRDWMQSAGTPLISLPDEEGIRPRDIPATTEKHLTGNTSTGKEPEPKDIRPLDSPERYLNANLWKSDDSGQLAELANQETLTVGRVYQLGIQIGPQTISVRVIGALPLIEKAFDWQPDIEGRWVEIGVTGLDFDVYGDPVQPLWLPRIGASDMIYFAVAPRTAGAARLRFCLYFQNNVIQSCRLAAITHGETAPDVPLNERPALLAKALDVPVTFIGDENFLARIEYSLTARPDDLANRPGRAVSIVANDLDGQPVVTVKGTDLFQVVEPDATLPDFVQAVREALDRVSSIPVAGASRTDWPYAYGQDNRGSADQLKPKLQTLAEAGWQLYSLFLDEAGRAALDAQLSEPGQTIHVAHVLLEKVIPWAALYDRNYDPERKTWNGRPVDHEVCLASLPASDGTLPVHACGQHPDCPLHPARKAERLQSRGTEIIEDTVVCSLHFWGFKHIIEIPPQQFTPQPAASQPDAAHTLRSCVLAAPPTVRLFMGYNATLPTASAHRDGLRDLMTRLKFSAGWLPPQADRDRILDGLLDTALDVIYLYCHARGGLAEPSIKFPYLEFQSDPATLPGRISAQNLDAALRWSHFPLVFLNGCGTAGFSPDALSPFIKKLVRGRSAAGVVGTEIPVWEQLAVEVANEFLEDFLHGIAAGQALLLVRRRLLAKYNPLGLIYTLYASADLQLDLDGDGKCAQAASNP